MQSDLIVIRGGGDIATGIVQKMHRAGLPVVILETECPMAIRRTVALAEAVRLGVATVEDVVARRVGDVSAISACHTAREIPLLVDPQGSALAELRPACVVDAILAKRNLGTHLRMAPIVVGVGPGFVAGEDVHAVIETMRGHDLGRLILRGGALPNTGVPGELGGKSAERVIHAPTSGAVRHFHRIGDVVGQGEVVLSVDGVPCEARFDGLLRGLIAEGIHVLAGTKIADIDPRTDIDCFTISDKARAIGGAVLEAYLYLKQGGRET